MCTGSKRELSPSGSIIMEDIEQKSSVLLELSASDDLIGFKTVVGEEGLAIDESGYWYGRKIGSKKMGFEERTPLMIASMFGSKQVLNYILQEGCVDVNKACGSDGATALHCAVAGGSTSLFEVVKLLLDASADVNCVDANGNRPVDLITPGSVSSFSLRRKIMDLVLKGCSDDEPFEEMEKEDSELSTDSTRGALKDGTEKKEYPVDLSFPDIKNGIYGTDEFRMYMFKVKPCSRAYSHDWTECPFVHPGENARRRDPRKYHYSNVPCPEFRKGTCRQGDNCEYAHGIFECWLHPAQYRTRLCKDETGCARKVCFFAHKPEELRPLYASTGSAVPSPRSFATNGQMEIGSVSPLALGSTSPMSPGASSPMGGSMWSNHPNLTPPVLNLSGSRLKTTLSARDMDLDSEFFALENQFHRQHQLMDETSGLSFGGDWNGELNRLAAVKPTNLDDVFGSLDPSVLYQLQGLSMDSGPTHLQSPTGMQIRQNMNQQMRSSYPSTLSSSPVRASPSFGIDQSLNSRSAAFAKRSQSFIDRGAVNRHSGFSSSPSSNLALSDWGSPDGKLDWGIQKEELSKLRKSASFGFRSNGTSFGTPGPSVPIAHESNPSWAQSTVNNGSPQKTRHLSFEEQQQFHLNSGGSEMFSPWAEQLYVEQEQLVA
ncbi:hypothetical protein LguiA_020853 [Lonicera macranthoides]